MVSYLSVLPKMFRKARAVLLHRGASHADADDLVQEAFLRLDAYTREAHVHEPEAVLVRTAVNLSIDLARRRRIESSAPTEAAALEEIDHAPTPEQSLEAKERFERACQGLAKLSPKARRILLGQRVYGMSYREIAKREGVSVAAIEKQIARAVNFLSQWMDREQAAP